MDSQLRIAIVGHHRQDRPDARATKLLRHLPEINKQPMRQLDEEVLAAVGEAQQLAGPPGVLEFRMHHDLGTGKDRQRDTGPL